MKKKNVVDIKMRSIVADRPAVIRLDSRDTLREVVVGFFRKNIAGGSIKESRTIKYEPILSNAVINGSLFTASLEIRTVMAKCLAVSKNHEDGEGIQSLTQETLNVIGKLTDAESRQELEMNCKPTAEKMLSLIVEAHWKQREREKLQNQFVNIKKTYAIKGKNKRVNFPSKKQLESGPFLNRHSEENSQRISRSTINCLQRQNQGRVHIPAASRSQLKALIDTCNIFDHPDRLQGLRKRKYLNDYCDGKEIDYLEAKQHVRKTYEAPSQSTLSIQTTQLLEEWINDISLSEYLFKKRHNLQVNRESSATSTPFSAQSSASLQNVDMIV